MEIEGLEFIRLSEDYEIKPFDCNDGDLNDFLFNSAKQNQSVLNTVTYLLVDENKTVAFFSLLNDKLSKQDVDSNRKWTKLFQSNLSNRKRYSSYPAVKIGRFAVSYDCKGMGIGRTILDYIKTWFIINNKTGCRIITVDAYSESIGFYEKNGFNYLTETDVGQDTRQMFFDLHTINV